MNPCVQTPARRSSHDIIDTMEAFTFFQEACCGVKPKENWVDSIKWFSEKYKVLHMTHDISITNKVHIICDHVEDYIRLTGKGLGRVSDQIVEGLHSALNKRLCSSNYWIKDVESEVHGNNFLKGICHFNSYNIC